VTTRLDHRIAVNRVVHAAIAIAFLVCMGVVWWAVLSGELTAVTAVAIGLLAGERSLVLLAGLNTNFCGLRTPARAGGGFVIPAESGTSSGRVRGLSR
jgi:hypothetical protein